MVTPIFLLSLPRSGSTLAQRILASHVDIATVSEPWILLPYLHTLRDRGVYAEYSHSAMVMAIRELCDSFPGGEKDYLEEIRLLTLRLYDKVAEGAKYFVDKTPRYHLVVHDIVELFPEAKLIFLWRNPLAVLASIMETWGKGKWNLYHYKIDLLDGLANLVEAYTRYHDRAICIRYEDSVMDPQREWQRVFAYLGLPFDPDVLSSFGQVRLGQVMGDQTGTRQYTTISRDPLTKWKTTLANPVRKAWCRRYLRWIGETRLATMGYDKETLDAELGAIRPSLRLVGSDLGHIAYDVAYHLLELRIIKHKLQVLPAWNRVHIHT